MFLLPTCLTVCLSSPSLQSEEIFSRVKALVYQKSLLKSLLDKKGTF